MYNYGLFAAVAMFDMYRLTRALTVTNLVEEQRPHSLLVFYLINISRDFRAFLLATPLFLSVA